MHVSKDDEKQMIERLTDAYYQRSRWDREGHQTRFEIAQYPYYCEHFSSYFAHKEEGYITYLKYYLKVLRASIFCDEIEDEDAFIKEKCEAYGLMESFKRVYSESLVYVIGDVHGCYYTLMQLIEKLKKEATLIFVGDLIDKGNFSKEVVEFVMESQHQCILGNHEALMLEHIEGVFNGDKSPEWSTKKYFGGYKTIASYKDDYKILQKHMAWLRGLPRYIEIEKFFITHAFGLPYYRRRDMPHSHKALMSNRPSDKQEWGWDWEEGYEAYDVVNIYGHEVVDEIDTSKQYIGIDTGCVYGKSLSAIELRSMEVISVQVDKRDIR